MIKFKNIIIDRLNDLALLKQELNSAVSDKKKINSIHISSAKTVPQINLKYRSQESIRLQTQLKYMKQLRIQQKPFRNICETVLSIMALYDREYKHIKYDQFKKEQVEYQFRRIFANFLLKHSHKKIVPVIQFLQDSQNKVIAENYVIWIDDWSKAMFYNQIREEKDHKQNFSVQNNSENSSLNYRSNTKKIKTQSAQQGSDFKINFFSKEHMFSFIKPQLNYYYSLFDCLDLDAEYLAKISRNPRKMEYSSYRIDQIVGYLVKTCNFNTNNSINNFNILCLERNRIKNTKVKTENSRVSTPKQPTKYFFTSNKRINNGNIKNMLSNKISSKLNYLNNWIQFQTPKKEKLTDPSKMLKNSCSRDLRNSESKDFLEFQRFNFIKRKEKEKNSRRELFKQINYTTLIYNNKESQRQSIKREFEPQSKGRGGNIIHKTDSVFVMDNSKVQFEDMKIKRELYKLKSKKYSLKISRQEALKYTSMKVFNM